MRRLMALLAASSVVFAGACVRTSREPATGNVDVDIESPTKSGEDWSAGIAAVGGSGISGTAKALVAGGESNVTISLAGASAGGTLPWHIHAGKCGSGGPIVGDASAYTPLTVGSDGRAAGNARVAVSLNEATDYYVNVHASPSDMATIVACGELDD